MLITHSQACAVSGQLTIVGLAHNRLLLCALWCSLHDSQLVVQAACFIIQWCLLLDKHALQYLPGMYYWWKGPAPANLLLAIKLADMLLVNVA